MKMLFSRTKRRNIDTEEFTSKVDNLIEGFRPELIARIEEFQDLENLECRKYIRKKVLIMEIERGKIFAKLLKIWLATILDYLLKFLQKDLTIDKLQKKDLERLYKDTRQNYAKKSLKQINRRLAREFAKAGYRYTHIPLNIKPEEAIESKKLTSRSPVTPEGKRWRTIRQILSVLRLPSLLAAIFSGIMYKFKFDWFSLFKILIAIVTATAGIHLFSGFANMKENYILWLEDIAKQIEELCKEEKMSSEAIAEQWITQLKEQAYSQIIDPPAYPWKRMVLVGILVLAMTLGGYSAYSYWPGSLPADQVLPADQPSSEEGTAIEMPEEEIIVEILDKETLLQRMQNWGKINVLTQSGSNLLLERTIPKKIFGGTIPTTDLQIKVTYDYSTDFILDMQGLAAEDLEIDQDVVKIYVPKPAIDSISITNDRKEMSGAVFADNGTPEEELEAFEPGDESYLDILRGNVKALLLKDQSLQSKVLLEAEKHLRTRLLDSEELINEVEVIFKG